MDADLVLHWLSEVGRGSARELRDTVTWLARTSDETASRAASGRWLRDMSALGHAEVDWSHDAWSVSPPVITRLPASDGTAVLAGARRRHALEALDSCDVALLRHRPVTAAGDLALPHTLMIQYDDPTALTAAARSSGAEYVGCAAFNIARRLPPLQLGARAAPPADANDTLERMNDSETGVQFARAASDSDGLYRLTLQGKRTHLYRRDSEWYHCDLSAGVFLDYARRGRAATRWRPERDSCYGRIGTFFVDWGAPMPALHARALTLCSGLPPRFSGAAHTAIYGNVPETIAQAVTRSLSQRLQYI